MRLIIIALMLAAALFGMYRLVAYFAPKKIGPAEIVGTLKSEEPAELEVALDKYFEKINATAGYKCAHIFYGLDEKFAYADMYCSDFSLEGERMKMKGGGILSTRIQLSEGHDDIQSYQQSREGSSAEQSKIFPPEVIELSRTKMSSKEKSDIIFAKIKQKITPPPMETPVGDGLPDPNEVEEAPPANIDPN